MMEEKRKEISRLFYFVCGPVDGEHCEIPDGLYYDEQRKEFRCKDYGYKCKRVCSTSGKLRKDIFKDANDLKLSLVHKNLKILCSYLRDHPETMKRREKCSECGNEHWYRCKICQGRMCKCDIHQFYYFTICGSCLNDVQEIGDLEKMIKSLQEKVCTLHERQEDLVKLWNKKKVWINS